MRINKCKQRRKQNKSTHFPSATFATAVFARNTLIPKTLNKIMLKCFRIRAFVQYVWQLEVEIQAQKPLEKESCKTGFNVAKTHLHLAEISFASFASEAFASERLYNTFGNWRLKSRHKNHSKKKVAKPGLTLRKPIYIWLKFHSWLRKLLCVKAALVSRISVLRKLAQFSQNQST